MIKDYYAKAHQDNLSKSSLVEGLNYISLKYTKFGLDLGSPYYRADMPEAEREMAFKQERALLLGGRVILGDSYALAASGGVLNIKCVDQSAIQSAREKINQLIQERKE